MLICGYSDYESKVSEMLSELERMKNGIEISENDLPGEAKHGKTA